MPDVPYAQVIGSLMYAALGSHPDIAFTVQQLSHRMHNFTIAHWTAVKHIIQYLKGTRKKGILLHHSSYTLSSKSSPTPILLACWIHIQWVVMFVFMTAALEYICYQLLLANWIEDIRHTIQLS